MNVALRLLFTWLVCSTFANATITDRVDAPDASDKLVSELPVIPQSSANPSNIDLQIWFQPDYVTTLTLKGATQRAERWVKAINEGLAESGVIQHVNLVDAQVSPTLGHYSDLPWNSYEDELGVLQEGVGSKIKNAIYNEAESRYENQFLNVYQPDLIMVVRDYRDDDEIEYLGLATLNGDFSAIFDRYAGDEESSQWKGIYDKLALHEIGHNLGAGHEISDQSSTGNLEPDAHASTCVNNTVMWSTIDQFTHPFFSDPEKQFETIYCGALGVEDNSRVISVNAPRAVNRRTPLTPSSSIGFGRTTYIANEEDQRIVIDITRDGDIEDVAYVDMHIVGLGNATPGLDTVAENVRVEFEPGVANKEIVLEIVSDDFNEGQEVFDLLLKYPGQTTIRQENSKSQLIIDDGASGELSTFDVSVPSEVFEGQDIEVNLIRSGNTQGNAFVIVDAVPGSTGQAATIPQDFPGGTVQVNFSDGETRKSILFPTINDLYDEPDKSIDIVASNYLGATIIGARQSVILLDDDEDYSEPFSRGEFYIEASDTYIRENAGSFTLKIYRVNGSDSTEIIELELNGGGTTVQDMRKTIYFAEGIAEVEVTVTVYDNTTYSGTSAVITAAIASPDDAPIKVNNVQIEVADDDEGDESGNNQQESGEGAQTSPHSGGGSVGYLWVLAALLLFRKNFK
ncbi:Calx-beta domain-containing protein [Alteromonas antoniana]|uniref:Calx-beta domain-containing protein n=1 Tax=Alteromonas antoniana TaxID=2803813 RepID=UPI001C454336|nr:Calx-beta domain-containing protein [Alteromonas antoniana]